MIARELSALPRMRTVGPVRSKPRRPIAVDHRGTTVGERVRLARRWSGRTQAQLAEDAELSLSLVSKLENGWKSPDCHTLGQIAYVLGVTMDALWFGDRGNA